MRDSITSSVGVHTHRGHGQDVPPPVVGIDPAVEFGLAGDDHISRNTPRCDGGEDDEDIDDVSAADREWWASVAGGWDVEMGPMECGYEEFDCGLGWDIEPEDVIVERHLRPRERSMRLSAEEECRDVFGWSR